MDKALKLFLILIATIVGAFIIESLSNQYMNPHYGYIN
jgi:hypothetical protein